MILVGEMPVGNNGEGPVGGWECCQTVMQVLKAGPGVKEQGKKGKELG